MASVMLTWAGTIGSISSPAPALCPDAQALRRHRQAVLQLAAQHGLSQIRVTPSGRLLLSVAENRTYVDIANFDASVEEAVGVAVESVPDGVLKNEGRSEDLDQATPL